MVAKGTKMSEESRQKMREAALRDGRHPPSRKGIPHTEEFKLAVSLRHRGKKDSLDTSKQRRISVKRGKDCHFWKGGMTPIARLIRASFEYRQWRKAVFERDNFTCVMCGDHGGRLNADHIKRFSDYPELRFDIDNGRTLCESCHLNTDTFGRWSNDLLAK